MRKSPASSTFPAGRKSSKSLTPQLRNSQLLEQFQSSSQIRAVQTVRIRSAVFWQQPPVFHHAPERPRGFGGHGHDIALPEVTKHAIMNYPLPDHQSGQKYSPFTYFHTDSGRNLCGTAHTFRRAEMLYCSSSSGEHFDKRARELRQSPNMSRASSPTPIHPHKPKPKSL